MGVVVNIDELRLQLRFDRGEATDQVRTAMLAAMRTGDIVGRTGLFSSELVNLGLIRSVFLVYNGEENRPPADWRIWQVQLEGSSITGVQ